MTKAHKILTTAVLASQLGMALSGPSRSMFGPSATLFKDDDPTAQIMGELKKIEDNLTTKLDKRLEEIKAGQNVPDQDAKIKQLESEHGGGR